MLITFHKNLKQDILQSFGKTLDKDKYVIDAETKKKVLTREAEELALDDFVGMTKGSVVYLKSDIFSLINYIDKKHGSAR